MESKECGKGKPTPLLRSTKRKRVLQTALNAAPAPLRRACLRQGARSAGFQPASGQDGRSPRKREGERPEAGTGVGLRMGSEE